MAPHRRGGHRVHRTAGRRIGTALLAAAAVAATLLVPAAPAQAIVGSGEKVTYPWAAVFLEPGSGPIEQRTGCSGVLIKSAWVLTAAHCTGRIESGDIVLIGRGDLYSNQGQARRVSYLHRMWAYSEFCPSRSRTMCDVAVVRLRAMSTQPDLDLAGPDVFSQWGFGSEVRTYGYGLWSRDPFVRATHLTRGHFQLGSFFQDHYRGYAWDDLDIGSEPSSPCSGDSGAPLVVSTSKGPHVVGIHRASFNCNPSSPSIYVKTGWRGSVENSPVYRWITWRI